MTVYRRLRRWYMRRKCYRLGHDWSGWKNETALLWGDRDKVIGRYCRRCGLRHVQQWYDPLDAA